jgi:uncharacterized protein
MEKAMKNRRIISTVAKRHSSRTGRIIVFTGARQTGKTTLARKMFPDYEYISVEDPVTRGEYSRMTASEWNNLYPYAILDEVQKEPKLIESIKSVYDQWEEPKYILLGSSQLLLLEKVKESLAGRCAIFELYPLTLPEIRTDGWNDSVNNSHFQDLLESEIIPSPGPSFMLDNQFASKNQSWNHYLKFGGYPAIIDKGLTDDERYDWLKDYVRTYLERDIRDLASFRELEPFIKLQRYLALDTATLINYSSIANQTGVTSGTVQRYINYFEISYQIIILSAWSRNRSKRLVKAPKIHYLDNGIIQAVLQKRGGITGNEFESLVIAEIYKQARIIQKPVTFFHLRTHDGREVDLLLELPEGYLAFEIKMADSVRENDARHLFDLEEILDKPLLHSYLLSQDNKVRQFRNNVTALHAAHFLG